MGEDAVQVGVRVHEARRESLAGRVAVLDAASARALMLAAPSVIKRPVVEWPQGRISVGFSEARFADLAARPAS